MSVKELSKGTWEVSVYLPGGRRFRRRYLKKKTANDVFNQVKAGIATGTLRRVLQQLNSSRTGLLRELADHYFETYCKARNRDLKTKKYRLELIKDDRVRPGCAPVP